MHATKAGAAHQAVEVGIAAVGEPPPAPAPFCALFCARVVVVGSTEPLATGRVDLVLSTHRHDPFNAPTTPAVSTDERYEIVLTYLKVF